MQQIAFSIKYLITITMLKETHGRLIINVFTNRGNSWYRDEYFSITLSIKIHKHLNYSTLGIMFVCLQLKFLSWVSSSWPSTHKVGVQ